MGSPSPSVGTTGGALPHITEPRAMSLPVEGPGWAPQGSSSPNPRRQEQPPSGVTTSLHMSPLSPEDGTAPFRPAAPSTGSLALGSDAELASLSARAPQGGWSLVQRRHPSLQRMACRSFCHTRKLEDVSPDGALWTCSRTGGPDHPPPQLSHCAVTNRRRTLRTCSDTSLPSPLRTSQDAGHSATAAPRMSTPSLWPVLRGDKEDAWLCPAPSRSRSSLREGRLQRPGHWGASGHQRARADGLRGAAWAHLQLVSDGHFVASCTLRLPGSAMVNPQWAFCALSSWPSARDFTPMPPTIHTRGWGYPQSPHPNPQQMSPSQTPSRVSWAHSCTQDAQIPQTLQVFGEASCGAEGSNLSEKW